MASEIFRKRVVKPAGDLKIVTLRIAPVKRGIV
jgi:hypothetical protein